MGKTLTELVNLAVACGRTGRTIASIGGMLTSKEQEQTTEIYSRLLNKEIIDEESKTTAIVTSKIGRKRKISQSEAINWFTEKYKKWSLPLQRKLKETLPPLTKTVLNYGLRGEEDLPDEFYIEVIRDVTNISRQEVINLYYEFLKPQMNKFDELSGLIETEIKEKNR